MRESLLKGMGIAVGETQDPDKPDPLPGPPSPPPTKEPVMSLGESARIRDDMTAFNAELAKEEEAAKATDPAKSEGDKKEEKPSAKPATKPIDPSKEKGTDVPAEPEPEKKVVVEKRTPVKQVIEDTVAATVAKLTPKPEPKIEPKPEPAPTAPPEGLNDAQLEEYELAVFAAKANPAKYKSLPDQLLAFYGKVNDYVGAEATKDEGRTFDDQDQEFQRFLKSNKPALDPVERRKLDRQKLKEEAVAEFRSTHEAEVSENKRRLAAMEARPVLEQHLNEFEAGITTILEEGEGEASEIVKSAKANGWQKTVEENPLFAPVIQQAKEQALTLAAEYLQIRNGTKAYDPKNKAHSFLADFIKGYGDHIASGPNRVRDGKTFLPMHDYNALAASDPEAAKKHWTIGDRSILEAIARNTKANVVSHIEAENKRLEKSGFVRQKKAPPAEAHGANGNGLPKTEKKISDASPATSPRVTSSPSPGLANSRAPLGRNALSPEEYKNLGLPVPA